MYHLMLKQEGQVISLHEAEEHIRERNNMYVIYDLIFMGQLKSRGYHGIMQHYIFDK